MLALGIAKQNVLSVFVWMVLAVLVGALIWFDPIGKRRHPADTGGRGSLLVASRDGGGGGDGSTPGDATPDVERADVDAGAPMVDARNAAPLYTVPDALEDVTSSPLEFIGTGAWFGNDSIHACAYRNARVIVVNTYCTMKETPAFGLAVLSPARGRVYVYAEADAPISTLERAAYITFRAEVQPPLDRDPVKLDITYGELNAWEERRYNAGADSCWYESGHGSCSGGLAPAAWSQSAAPFITEPPPSWYQLTKDLHARAVRDLRKKK